MARNAFGRDEAEGPVGWNFMPGLCSYKFLYVWLDLLLASGERVRNLGWMYWLPNPLFPFIWFRVGIPQSHPELEVEFSASPSV